MFNEKLIRDFATALHADQQNTPEGINQYDAGKHIHSINFETSYLGDVTAKVHVQWQLMRSIVNETQAAQHKAALTWTIEPSDNVIHLYLTIDDDSSIVYTAVMFKYDLEKVWRDYYDQTPDINSCPQDWGVERLWARLYTSGVWCQ